MDIFCDENFHCSLFDRDSRIISYDGAHLTKSGAKYLGEKLRENEIIKNKLFQSPK